MAGTKPVTSARIEELAKKPGTHRVEADLYHQVKGGVSWLGRHWITDRGWQGQGLVARLWELRQDPGKTSLADARARRDADRVRLHTGYNPFEENAAEKAAQAEAERPRKTFREPP
jgi:hypothetical protein